MKQRALRPKKRGAQASAPKDLSEIGVDKIRYNPADDFFIVSQENLGGPNSQPAAKRSRRKPRGTAPVRLGGFLLLLLGACVALPALTMTSNPSLDTSAVVVPDSGVAAETARGAETARQEAAAVLAQREHLKAQQAAEAAHEAQLRAAAAAEQARLDAAEARDETVVYENCTDVWDKLGRAVLSTEPGYSDELDRDGDGTGCESRPAR